MKGSEFREKRMNAGISISALSKLIRVDVSTITRWESGKRNISKPMQILIEYVIKDINSNQQIGK